MKQDDIQRTINMLRHKIPATIAQSIVGVQPMGAGSFFAPYSPKVVPKSKYQFSRAKWYVAEFDDRYYFEVEAWCSQHFGPHPARPDAWSRWVHKYSQQIHFRDEKDYQWFILRWGA